ncbi:MAG: hypothetical protein WCB53_14085 [Terriglobales bacterium]
MTMTRITFDASGWDIAMARDWPPAETWRSTIFFGKGCTKWPKDGRRRKNSGH